MCREDAIAFAEEGAGGRDSAACFVKDLVLLVALAFVLAVVDVRGFVRRLFGLGVLDSAVSVRVGFGLGVFDSSRRRPTVTVSLSKGSCAPCSHCQ